MGMEKMFSNIRCEDCKFYRRLKYGFEVGNGFKESHCCILFANDPDAFILEVSSNDYCEEYTKK